MADHEKKVTKSLFLAYFYWLIGGVYGLHHIYLQRYKHAFLFLCTPGGYFGFGWFRDLWRLPEYVRDFNDDKDFLDELSVKMRKNTKPPFSWLRFVVMVLFANLFATLMLMAFPDKNDELGPGIDFSLLSKALMPVASAFAIWVVGNIGREQGAFKWPLMGCLLASPLYFYFYWNYHFVTMTGIILFNWKAKSWRKKEPKLKSTWRHITCLFACGLLYTALWSSHLYFNMKITTAEGDEIRLRDAIGNLIKSPAFQHFSDSVKEIFQHLQNEGFSAAWHKLILSLDPLGEENALEVLELNNGASQSEIKARYREMSKKWHPDRYKDEKEKEEAHQRFVEIQQAYETLSELKNRRSNINKRSREKSESASDSAQEEASSGQHDEF